MNMNSLYDNHNDAIVHGNDTICWQANDNDEERDVWMPKPSLDALWAPPTMNYPRNDDNDDDGSSQDNLKACDSFVPFGGDPHFFSFETKPPPRAETPETRPPHDHCNTEGVPATILVPTSPAPVTPVMDTRLVDICLAHETDDDDCSSVGMETTIHVESSSRKRRFDDISSMVNSNKKKLKYDESSQEEEESSSGSIVSSPKELQWDGSLSFLDGMAEHAWVVVEEPSQAQHDDVCKIDDTTTVGTFDVPSTSDVAPPAFTMSSFGESTHEISHDDNDSSTSCSSSFCSSKFQVVETGTSIQSTYNAWDGSFTFLDAFPSNKHASLCDFLDAEAKAGIMTCDWKRDFFLPPTFLYA